MAEKVSTLIIEANLECEKCYRKIQKVLCKLQDKEKIRNINFDTKKNTVTISGPFDTARLSRKIRCRACEAIKDIKVPEEKKPEGKEEKKPDEKKPEEKKTEGKKEEKKTEGKEEEKKPDDKKDGDKPKEETKPAASPPSSSSTTVNLQFTQMCNICYPWPCSDPSHWGAVHPQPPQPQWPCGATPPLPAFPGHHQHPPWPPATPKWACGGPSYCGGCGSCRGGGMHGWPAMPMCCPGPSSCRGCKGCRIVQEGKFIYEEYPPSSCAVM